MDQNINIGRRMQLCVCDRTLTGELTTDHSMPDYQPEIRRLLRVNATVMPPATYVGAGNAELSGTVRYDILYAAPDGGLYSTAVTEEYGMTAPLERGVDTGAGEVVLACDVCPDVVVSRVTAPRRISIRTRLKARVQGFGERSTEEELQGEYELGDLERLAGEVTCGAFAASGIEPLEMSEVIAVDGEGDLRIVSSSAELCVSEILAGEGTVSCRGDAVVKLLLCADGEGAIPFTVTRKLPFTQTLVAEGFCGGMSCFARAECGELRTSIEENKVYCDLRGSLCVFGQENRPVAYTKDIFSTAHEGQATYCTVEYPYAFKCQSGNLTQSLYEPIESFGIDGDSVVIDLTARALADSLVGERGKWALSGETKLWLLLKCGDEYLTKELSIPFRYEFEGEEGELLGFSSDIRMMSGRARVDGGRLSVDCEMAVAVRLLSARRVEMLSGATFSEPCECYRECVVCFPRETDTLWDVAKKYHVSSARLRSLNRGASDDGGNGYLIVNE